MTLTQITNRAKQIRKKHPSKKWTDCIKQASRELKTGKAAPAKRVVKKKKSAVKKKRIGSTKNAYRQTGSSNRRNDQQRTAKAPGKRIVKHAGKKSTVYYERRKNRSDKPGTLSGAGVSQDHAIQRVIMKRRLRVKGVSVDNNIADAELQKAYTKLTARKVPSIAKIRAKLKKGISPSQIIASL